MRRSYPRVAAAGGGGTDTLQSILRAGRRAVRDVFGASSRQRRRTLQQLRDARYARVVYKGQYRRVRLPGPPPTMSQTPVVPKLPHPPPAMVPRPFKHVGEGASSAGASGAAVATKKAAAATTAGAGSAPASGAHAAIPKKAHPPGAAEVLAGTSASGAGGAAALAVAGAGARQQRQQSSRAYEWLKLNGPLLMLNFGSLCTLVGFTRSDVLELRTLSMTGSTAFVVYQFFQPPPIRWAPIAWSTLFASVNGYKISRILIERKAKVELQEHEEEIFVEHFMEHGVTPKQFETLMKKATTAVVPKGECIVKKGEPLTSVTLIVEGRTRANILGRRLTAASSAPGNRGSNPGGDSGAWIGEMAFLESYFKRHQPVKKATPTAPPASAAEQQQQGAAAAPPEAKEVEQWQISHAIYTIVAAEECETIRWSFEDLERLMEKSADLRSALTRAMTAAIVGKVINFTISRTTAIPTWSTWLDDWKHGQSGVLRVASKVGAPFDDFDTDYDDDDEDEAEKSAGKVKEAAA